MTFMKHDYLFTASGPIMSFEGTGFMNDIFLLILRGAVLLYI